MIEIEVNKENLEYFIENIRNEDKEELEYIFKDSYKKKFIDICLKEKNIIFFADDKKIPCAIGGIQAEQDNTTGLKKGRIWLLCSKNSRKSIFFIFKYVKNKINEFKKDNHILYNYIYKSNFSFLRLLKKYGFKVIDIDLNLKLFYFKQF